MIILLFGSELLWGNVYAVKKAIVSVLYFGGKGRWESSGWVTV